MLYINNNIFLDLSDHLDIVELDKLHNDISMGIAKSEAYMGTGFTPMSTLYDKKKQSFIDEWRLLRPAAHMETLTDRQLATYIHAAGAVTLGKNLAIRGISGYPATYKYKHLAANTFDSPSCANFPSLLNWIRAQNCFEQIGRITFWFSEPQQKSALHTDYGNYSSNIKDQFIWITGKYPKRLAVLDQDTGIEHLSSTRACIFNNNNWHAGYGHNDYMSWSLRIDGVFRQAWAQQANIAEYFEI